MTSPARIRAAMTTGWLAGLVGSWRNPYGLFLDRLPSSTELLTGSAEIRWLCVEDVFYFVWVCRVLVSADEEGEYLDNINIYMSWRGIENGKIPNVAKTT